MSFAKPFSILRSIFGIFPSVKIFITKNHTPYIYYLKHAMKNKYLNAILYFVRNRSFLEILKTNSFLKNTVMCTSNMTIVDSDTDLYDI